MSNSIHRQIFFDKQVKTEAWKNSMAGQNENEAIKILEALEFVINKDFVRQHPIGERFVMDFAFINEKVAVEIDGKNHDEKKQRALDRKRDIYLHRNGWLSIRIKDKDLVGYKGSFYKNLIRDVVLERREQYDKGVLYHIDIPNYNEKDYE